MTKKYFLPFFGLCIFLVLAPIVLNKAFIVQDPDGHRLLIYQNSNE